VPVAGPSEARWTRSSPVMTLHTPTASDTYQHAIKIAIISCELLSQRVVPRTCH
jgi:hypothetical protein